MLHREETLIIFDQSITSFNEIFDEKNYQELAAIDVPTQAIKFGKRRKILQDQILF